MLRKFCLPAIFLVCLLVGVRAHATPILAGTYTLSNVSVSDGTSQYSLVGSVTIGNSGLLTAADVVLKDTALGNPEFNVLTYANSGGYAPVADFGYLTNTANTGQLYLSYLTTSDASGGVRLCVLSAGNCNTYQASSLQIYGQSSFGYNQVVLSSGAFAAGASSAVTSTATTPEPGSLLLLASGLLGTWALVRRRRTEDSLGFGKPSA